MPSRTTTTLVDLLETIPVRERGGAIATNRFDYQKNWALCHLLELHERGQDYTLVMEHHEDVLVLDSATAPTRADFFQIKTRRDGVWSKRALLKRRNQEPERSSVLGRLYGNRLRFRAATGSLNLISNATFNLKLTTGHSRGLPLVRASDLDEDEMLSISSALASEHGVGDAGDFASLTEFQVCPLSIDGHATFALGRLGEYLDRRFPEHPHPTAALHRTLFDLVTRLQDIEQTPPTMAELVRKKAITRSQLEAYLVPIGRASHIASSWQLAAQQLLDEGLPLPQLHRITAQRSGYEVQRMDRTNRVMQQVGVVTRLVISRTHAATPVVLRTLIASVADEVRQSDPSMFGVFSSDFMMAAALLEYITYEESSGSLSAPDTQSEAQDA